MLPLYQFWYKNNRFNVLTMDFIKNEVTIAAVADFMDVQTIPVTKGVLLPYSGQVDSHGTPLYAGDIVQATPLLVSNIPTVHAVIEWDKYRFALRTLNWKSVSFQVPPMRNFDSFGFYLKKVGDIYANAELAAG